MSKFFRAVKAGIRGARSALGPGRYQAAGAQVVCSHCRGEVFQAQEAQMNTAGMTAANLDAFNRSGTALICSRCGLIQWFAKAPDRVYE
jgi:uncharacterized protein